MTRKNLTKKQLRKATITELIFAMSSLFAECMRRPKDAGVPMVDILDSVSLIEELRVRRNDLLKKKIQKLDTDELNSRYCHILKRAKKKKAKDIPVMDAWEILFIEDELHLRTITAVGHDFYPPEKKS